MSKLKTLVYQLLTYTATDTLDDTCRKQAVTWIMHTVKQYRDGYNRSNTKRTNK